jgi:hypothetical protein
LDRRLLTNCDLREGKPNSSDAMSATLPERFGTSMVERLAKRTYQILGRFG